MSSSCQQSNYGEDLSLADRARAMQVEVGRIVDMTSTLRLALLFYLHAHRSEEGRRGEEPHRHAEVAAQIERDLLTLMDEADRLETVLKDLRQSS